MKATKKTSIAAIATAAPVVAKIAKPKTVALRGGAAIATVNTAGAKPYRTAAKHNADWYATVQSACAKGAAPVADLIEAGVPSHFLGYCVRRGYVVGV